MAVKQKGLGRGLGALINEVPIAMAEGRAEGADEQGLTRVPVSEIRRNPWQPRKGIDPDILEDLVRSIREKGVLQPLLVRRIEGGYELIAGERRLTAAREAELREVPVVVMEATDREALELALIENLQREDLNVIEEAEGYQALCDKFGMTQEQVAQCMGKARATIANALRLLNLEPEVRSLVESGVLSAGHAKVLLSVGIADEQVLLAGRVVKEGLSVRALERDIERSRKPPRRPRVERADIPAAHLRDLEDRLHHHFGTAVRLTSCRTLANGKKAKGRLEIDYYSPDDLDRVLDVLGIRDEW